MPTTSPGEGPLFRLPYVAGIATIVCRFDSASSIAMFIMFDGGMGCGIGAIVLREPSSFWCSFVWGSVYFGMCL